MYWRWWLRDYSAGTLGPFLHRTPSEVNAEVSARASTRLAGQERRRWPKHTPPAWAVALEKPAAFANGRSRARGLDTDSQKHACAGAMGRRASCVHTVGACACLFGKTLCSGCPNQLACPERYSRTPSARTYSGLERNGLLPTFLVGVVERCAAEVKLTLY